MDKYITIIKHCVDKILGKKKKPLLIAVCGDSGSGKSHYARLICQEFSSRGIQYTYVNHDDFFIPRVDREPMKRHVYLDGEFAGKTHWEILENMFYTDKFHETITKLKERKPATYYPYLRETGDISIETKTVEPADYIIFDTSMFLDHMDVLVLIDVSKEKIIERKLVRDRDIRTPEQIIDMHQKVQGYYWDRKKPENPDIIIDNNDFDNPKIVKI